MPRSRLRPGGFRGLTTRAFLCLAVLALPLAAEEIAEFDKDTGYRISRYRAPTPDSVPGGTIIDYEDVGPLLKEKSAILLDVMAAEGGGPDPATGAWRLIKQRRNIPGSVWLPDVGRGRISPGLEAYFKSNLEELTKGDPSRAIIIYCVSDCWMGWNAVQRAARWGYTQIYWYPAGSDGWLDWDGTLAIAEAKPMAPGHAAQCGPDKIKAP